MALGILVIFVLAGVAFAGTSGPAPIPNPPSFVLSSNLTTLCKGNTNLVPITVTNLGDTNPSVGLTTLNGTTMQYLELSVSNTKSISFAGNGTEYISGVRPFNSAQVLLPVFVASNASLISSVQVSITYYYLQYYSDTETRNLTFEVKTCPSSLSVQILPKTLTSGTIQNVSVNLTNTGNSTLQSVYMHLSMPSVDGAVIGTSQSELASMAPGSSYTINTSVFVSRNASIESFPFNTTVTFYQNHRLQQVSNSTSMIPIGGIKLNPSGITLSPASTTPGSIFSISFVLTDLGTAGASATMASAVLPEGFTSFGSNPVYIGDIAADTQSPVTVTLVTGNQTRPGKYTIPIVINYLNSLRQNVSTTMNVTVNVGAAGPSAFNASSPGARAYRASGGSGLMIGVIAVMVIIIAVLAYLLIKERGKSRGHSR